MCRLELEDWLWGSWLAEYIPMTSSRCNLWLEANILVFPCKVQIPFDPEVHVMPPKVLREHTSTLSCASCFGPQIEDDPTERLIRKSHQYFTVSVFPCVTEVACGSVWHAWVGLVTSPPSPTHHIISKQQQCGWNFFVSPWGTAVGHRVVGLFDFDQKWNPDLFL